jgi:glycosyltransferase involved in cell wall biosynthesis
VPVLSTVLPAHNEAGNISRCVDAAEAALRFLVASGELDAWEIVVVDDGSTDDTAQVIRDRGQAEVRLVQHSSNAGYGAALRTGFQAARGDLVFFTDADLQFDAFELARLMPLARDHDIVMGYRSPRQDPWMRRANAWAWGRTLNSVFGLDVQDVNCAFKLFHRRVLEAISIESEGAFINAEILLKAKRLGFRMCQVPVSHFARTDGSQSGADPRVVMRAFVELARFYRSSWPAPNEMPVAMGPWTSESRAASVASTIRYP